MNIAAKLCRWGIENNHDCGCHAGGTIRRGKQVVGYYEVCDSLPDEAVASIPGAIRIGIGKQYAPEIRKPAVMVYSKAEMKRRASV